MTPGPGQDEQEMVAALLALRQRAERSSSTGSGSCGPDASGTPEAGWRRTRLAALGLLPRFPRR